jgi:hypothetical protein
MDEGRVMKYYRMPRYTISEEKYGVNFPRRDYVPEDLVAEMMESDREFRELVFRQMNEQQHLYSQHAAERLSAILRYKRKKGKE